MSREDQLQSLPVASARVLAEYGEADFSIYLSHSTDDAPTLYRAAGTIDTGHDFHRLHDAGVSHILVRGEDLAKCEEALEANLDYVLFDPLIKPLRKVQCLQYVGTSVGHDLLSGESLHSSIDRASNLLDIVIEHVPSDKLVAAILLNTSEQHRSIAGHMFAVSTLAVLLGAEVSGAVDTTLRELGLAGILHDLGKVTIDPELLNKPTQLTPAEMELVRQHPVESVRLIGDHPDVTSTVRQMILQHHERLDGRGYPLGLTDDSLLTGSKIISIVDSFHAMIGRRNYRGFLEPADAIQQLKYQSGKQFDAELLVTWESLFKRCWKNAAARKSLETEESEVGSAYHDDHRSTPAGETQRKQERLPCKERATVRCYYAGRLVDASAAPDEFVSPLHDLSRGGVCMFVIHPMYRGEVVHLLIEAGGEKMWVNGIVRWCRKEQKDERYKVGIQFGGRISEDHASDKSAVIALDDPELFPPTGS